MAAEDVDGLGDPGAFRPRLLLAADVVGYGYVDEAMQRQFREQMKGLIGEVAEGAGLNRAGWWIQEYGDSLLAVLPEATPYPALVGDFMATLYVRLREFNSYRTAQARLRLRVAVHFGTVSQGLNGFEGRALVEIGRILNCAALRNAMAEAPDVCLAVAVSETAFRDVVLGGYSVIRPEQFRQVTVREKEYLGEAWIWVPGITPTHEEPLTRDEAAAVAIDSGKSIDHALARLFVSLGPPPDPTELDQEPVSSGDGGARQ